MKKEKLQQLLAGDFDDVVKAVSVKPKKKTSLYEANTDEIEDPLQEFNVHDHPVFDPIKRKDVQIKEKEKNDAGKEVMRSTGWRKVNRIGIAMEELIAGRAAAFLCGLPVKYNATPNTDAEKKFLAAFKRVNEANKLDFKNLSILKQRMSELQVAEIWYTQDLDEDDEYWGDSGITNKKSLRVFIASPSLGDKLYPVWDDDLLIAFGREWEETTEDEKTITHFDLYTKEKIYEATKEGDSWEVKTVDSIGKLSVIYHYQAKPEWDNARTQIRRLEFLASNHADSNDKTMSPILFVTGPKNAIELPKGEAQRAMRGDKDTDAKYITADNAPQSLELEMKNLWKFVFETTNTVDISPETVQGIGQISGVGLELLFLPAMLKAAEHAGTFGECLQRRINLIKKMLVTIEPGLQEGFSLNIKPSFDFFLPKDLEGIITYLSTATQSGILSRESAVKYLQSVMGGDGVDELQKVLNEKDAEAKSAAGLDNAQNEGNV